MVTVTTATSVHEQPAETASDSQERSQFRTSHEAETVAEVLRRAQTGDAYAWQRLHDHFAPMLRGIARSYRLSASDVEDVMQNSWLQLVSHIDRLRQPAAVASWLATTTRRDCLRLLQRPTRECLSDNPDPDGVSDFANPERELLVAEQLAVLGRALGTLPKRHRRLMTLLVTEPDLDYQQLSATLAMPVGSIGPIRARSLVRLQRDPDLRCVCSTST